MGKLIKRKAVTDPEDLKQLIIDADVWMLVIAKKDKDGNGAEISVRESYHTAAINMISMLLEQKEIYDAVQAKIAQVKVINKQNGNNSQDITVN